MDARGSMGSTIGGVEMFAPLHWSLQVLQALANNIASAATPLFTMVTGCGVAAPIAPARSGRQSSAPMASPSH